MHAFDPTRVDNYPDWAFRGVMAFATLGEDSQRVSIRRPTRRSKPTMN